MSADGFHPPLEEYLEAILELEEEGEVPIQARLAERVGHSAPSVSEMVKRMTTEGWLTMSGRTIGLTSKGRDRATSVVRKHRLAERLLTDIIGLPWHKTHIEACRWEHVISDEVEERLIELLGNPSTCPHGNPIPGGPPPDQADALASLDGVDTGERFVLQRVSERVETDQDTLAYLDHHAFTPGAEAVITERAPDGTLSIAVGHNGDRLSVGTALAAQLLVSPAAARPKAKRKP
jgi:DtxR family Mn-dependent transcriptional regulator